MHENSVTSLYIPGIDFLTYIALMDGGVQWLLVTQDDSETRKRDTRHGWRERPLGLGDLSPLIVTDTLQALPLLFVLICNLKIKPFNKFGFPF